MEDVGQCLIDNIGNASVLVADIAKQQRDKGIKKYGKPLCSEDKGDWTRDILEEIVDAMAYTICEIAKNNEKDTSLYMQALVFLQKASICVEHAKSEIKRSTIIL